MRKFRLDSVDNRLEEFLAFLDARRSALPDVVSFLVEEFREIWAASNSPNKGPTLTLVKKSPRRPGVFVICS